jgi:hypothetical protein
MAKIDFPAISDRGAQSPGPSPREPQPGDTWDETVYEDTGGDWKNGEWGDEIGKVTLKHSGASDRGVVVHASFTFHGDDNTIEATGPVPGNGTWRGKGTLRIVRSTGKFANRKDELPVESTNPKRWG